MAFNLQTWRDQCKAYLKDLKQRIADRKVDSIYGTIAAAALWPVIAAFQQGDLSALVALGQVLAGVGTNLLAGGLQSWRDQAEAARDLQARIEKEPDLREELDAIIEKLGAFSLAKAELPERERQWFVNTLRQELQLLGNLPKFEALFRIEEMRQSVAVTGDLTVDEGGQFVSGSVGGDVLGPGATKIVQASAAEQEQQRREQARRRYLEKLRRHCQALPLAALGGEEGTEEELTLDRVYIDLDTKTPVEIEAGKKKRSARIGDPEQETRPLSALEAATQFSRLALLGDPGAGKSTFARKLLAWQAAALLGETSPPPGFTLDLLPIQLVLRDLAPQLAHLELQSLSEERQSERLAAAVRDQILDDLNRMEATAFAESLRDDFNRGRCLLVLDGLDEVPFDWRERVRQAVTAVIRQYALQRIIVTCRVRSYVGAAVLPNFLAHTLAPFDKKKIEAFTVAWYNAQKEMGRFDAAQAGQKAQNLAQAALSEDLRELAENPMMLTTMAIIHQREIGLPKERVRLYFMAVDVLLRRWQKGKSGESDAAGSPALARFLRDDLSLRAVMERLAYEAHRTGKGEKAAPAMADLARGTALTLLEAPEYLGSTALAAEFLDYVDQRAGLLVGKGGDEKKQPLSYSFPHRIFQEYLAGCFMVGQRNPARQYLLLVEAGDYWAQAAQLGAEELLYNRRGDTSKSVFDLAYRLCPSHDSNTTASRRACLWSGNVAALLGHEALARDAAAPDGDKTYLDRLLPRLQTLLGSDLSAPERAEAGVALAHLGDPRREVTTIAEMQFCLVPAGPFWMGSDEDKNEKLHLNEHLSYDYWISRFPITNAQFAEFVRTGGYDEPRYWPEAKAAEVWKDGEIKGWRDDQPRRQPHDFGAPFNLQNHPVVGITWYEMLAFTRWLTDIGHERKWLDAKMNIVLPSEAEWEKAARGGEEILQQPLIIALDKMHGRNDVTEPRIRNDTPQRRYPWGDDPDSNRANYSDTGIGATNAVGSFAAGASPFGCEEMSGNVWEWTRSLLENYPYDPQDGREMLGVSRLAGYILRGGAFSDDDWLVRCAARSGGDPSLRDVSFGLCVVLRPLL